MYVGDELAGYFQYSVSDTTLLVEESEIKSAHQRTFLFLHFCRFFLDSLPEKVQYLEVCVNKGNAHSLRINQKLGMEIVGENRNGKSWRLRGGAAEVHAHFSRKRR